MNHIKTQLMLDLLLQQVQHFGMVLTEVSPHAKQMLGDWGRNLQNALFELNNMANNDILLGQGPKGQALGATNAAFRAAGQGVVIDAEGIAARLPQQIPSPRVGPFANHTEENWPNVLKTLRDPASNGLFNASFNTQQNQQSYKAMARLLNKHRMDNGQLRPWSDMPAAVSDQPLDLINFSGNEAVGLYPGLNIAVLQAELARDHTDVQFLLLPLESVNKTFLLATRFELRFITWVELEETWSVHNRHEFANAEMVDAAIVKWLGKRCPREIELTPVLQMHREEISQIPPMRLEEWRAVLQRSNNNAGNQFKLEENGNVLTLRGHHCDLRLTFGAPDAASASTQPVEGPVHVVPGGIALMMRRTPGMETPPPAWDELTLRTRGQICEDLFQITMGVVTLLEPEITAYKAAVKKAAKKVAKKAVKKATAKKSAARKGG